MSSEPALLSIDGPIATITLNRPEAFNSVNLAIAQKLEQLGAEVEANDGIKVLVIQGEGRAFSAGGDLQTIGAAAEADTIAPDDDENAAAAGPAVRLDHKVRMPLQESG